MRRIGHILEHSPTNIGHIMHSNSQARTGEYLTQVEEQQSDEHQQTYWGQQDQGPSASSTSRNEWVPDPAPMGLWPSVDSGSVSAYAGFPQDDDESSGGETSTDTSDSGNEQLDFQDVQGMTEQEAA